MVDPGEASGRLVGIRTLPDRVANQIAAGEVVERPASVVKELVENALDATATNISVTLRNGGKSFIEVTDDGSGMGRDDSVLAFDRHATSKIRSAEDLKSVTTMGFRGEALPSIASISRLTLQSSLPGSESGVEVTVHGGRLVSVKDAPPLKGARVTVSGLFFNTPVRRKFLRSENVEAGHCLEAVYRQALGRPEVAFRFIREGKLIFDAPVPDAGATKPPFLARIETLPGRKGGGSLLPVSHEYAGMRLEGFVSRPGSVSSGKSAQYVFINNRFIRDRLIGFAVSEAFRSLAPKGRPPSIYLRLTVSPARMDVNVHPSKTEVRFVDSQGVITLVREGLLLALESGGSEYRSSELRGEEKNEAPHASMQGYSRKPVRPAQIRDVWAPAEPKPWVEPVPEVEVESKPTASPASPPKASENREPIEKSSPLPDSACKTPSSDPVTAQKELLMGDPSLPANFTVIGQVFRSFILIEEGDRLMLLDQHTVHERILFEKFSQRYKEGKVDSQKLLFPQEIELQSDDAAVMEGWLDQFSSLGYIIEPFGEGIFVVRAVPALIQDKDHISIILDLVEVAGSFGRTKKIDEVAEEVISVMACRAAVKAGDVLDTAEIDALIGGLKTCRTPYTCPHGRPISVAVEKEDLLKVFLRK